MDNINYSYVALTVLIIAIFFLIFYVANEYEKEKDNINGLITDNSDPLVEGGAFIKIQRKELANILTFHGIPKVKEMTLSGMLSKPHTFNGYVKDKSTLDIILNCGCLPVVHYLNNKKLLFPSSISYFSKPEIRNVKPAYKNNPDIGFTFELYLADVEDAQNGIV